MKQWLVVVMLFAFSAIGIGNILRPGWFVRRSGARKGGALLKDWNELGFQIAGAIFAAFAIYGIYLVLNPN
jgi:hypothetical protein